MNTSSRFLVAAALLATLAACGNKGPLLHPPAPADATVPAAAAPPSSDPADTPPAPPLPAPADDSGGGNG